MAALIKGKKSVSWNPLKKEKNTAEQRDIAAPERPATIVCPVCGREIDRVKTKKN